jgi:hypothetical protein
VAGEYTLSAAVDEKQTFGSPVKIHVGAPEQLHYTVTFPNTVPVGTEISVRIIRQLLSLNQCVMYFLL